MYDTLGILVGFGLTLCIFSYIIADNFLFRLAIHVFIGSTAGYVAAIVIYNVVWSQLAIPLLIGRFEERIVAVIPILLSTLLLTKVTSRFTSLGNPVLAFIVGAGAAVAIGGSVMGTIFPQVLGTADIFSSHNIINGAIILFGAVTSLIYFNFSARMREETPIGRVMDKVSWVGHGFIAITFGALLAGVLMAALTALVERLSFLLQFIQSFVIPAF